MDRNSTASAGSNDSTPSEISDAERQRLEHLSEELDLRFDIDNLSSAEAQQLIGELEKRAARQGQEDVDLG